MKENLEIIMNKKVVSSARAIKLNVSLHCSKCVQYCVLWQRVKRGNFQWFLMKQQIKIIFWQGDHPIKKKKKSISLISLTQTEIFIEVAPVASH